MGLYECLLVAHHLLVSEEAGEIGGVLDGGEGAVKNGAVTNWTAAGSGASTSHGGRIELLTLLEALAALNGACIRELEVSRSRLQYSETKWIETERQSEVSKAESRHAFEGLHAEVEVCQRRQVNELHDALAELKLTKEHAEALAETAARETENTVQANNRVQVLERQVQEAEIKQAELMQRAQRAESKCWLFGEQVEEREKHLQQALMERGKLLGDAELKQRELHDVNLGLRSEFASLKEESNGRQDELQRARRMAEERAGEIVLLEAKKGDLERRVAGMDSALRAAESGREEALRTVKHLQDELSVQKHVQHDSDRHARSLELELDTARRALAAAETRLQQR